MIFRLTKLFLIKPVFVCAFQGYIYFSLKNPVYVNCTFCLQNVLIVIKFSHKKLGSLMM